MKNIITIIIAIIINGTALFGQEFIPYKETEHFIYEKDKQGHTLISPKSEINTLLSKGNAFFGYYKNSNYEKFRNQEYWPLMELVEKEALFSKERIKELKDAQESIGILLYFDETGKYGYVSFITSPNCETLLTDNEMYKITQKYKQCKFDLSPYYVKESKTGSKTVFYNIAYVDLYYDYLKNVTDFDTIPLARINGNDFTYITNDKDLIQGLPTAVVDDNSSVFSDTITITGSPYIKPLIFNFHQNSSTCLYNLDISNYEGKQLLSIGNQDGWQNLTRPYSIFMKQVNPYTPFYIRTKGYSRGSADLFILYGGTASQPGFVTLVLVTQTQAKVVLNCKAIIKSIQVEPSLSIQLTDPDGNNLKIISQNGYLFCIK